MKKFIPFLLVIAVLPFHPAWAIKSPFTTYNGDEKMVTGQRTPFSSWEHPPVYRQYGKGNQVQGRKGENNDYNGDEDDKSGVRSNNGNFATHPQPQSWPPQRHKTGNLN